MILNLTKIENDKGRYSSQEVGLNTIADRLNFPRVESKEHSFARLNTTPPLKALALRMSKQPLLGLLSVPTTASPNATDGLLHA